MTLKQLELYYEVCADAIVRFFYDSGITIRYRDYEFSGEIHFFIDDYYTRVFKVEYLALENSSLHDIIVEMTKFFMDEIRLAEFLKKH